MYPHQPAIEDVLQGSIISYDLSRGEHGHKLEAEATSLGIVTQTHFDEDEWCWKIHFVHPYSVLDVDTFIQPEHSLVLMKHEDVSDGVLVELLGSLKTIPKSDIAALIKTINRVRKTYGA